MTSEPSPRDFTRIPLQVATRELFSNIDPSLLQEFMSYSWKNEGHSGPHVAQWEVEYRLAMSRGEGINGPTAKAYDRFVKSVTGMVLQSSEADDPYEEVDRIMDDSFPKPASEVGLSLLPFSIKSSVEVIQSLRVFSVEILGRLNLETPEQEFEFLKILAEQTPAKAKGIRYGDEAGSLQTLYLFNSLDASPGAQIPNFAESLNAGIYDSQIAKELFESVKNRDEGLDQGQTDLKNLLNIGIRLSEGKTEQEVIEHLASSDLLPFWLEEPRKALEIRRAFYRQGIEDSFKSVLDYLSDWSLIVTGSTIEEVNQAADALITQIMRQRSTNTHLSMKQRLDARNIIAESTKRKRLQQASTAAGQLATTEVVAQPETQARALRDLVYVKPNGETVPEGGEECEALFRQFIEDHPDQKGLDVDIRNIRDFLKRMDLSAGFPRGVYKMLGGNNIVRGQTRIPKVYEINPGKVHHLSTKSGRGEKLRVYFTLMNDTIAVLGVLYKENERAVHNALGIRGSSKRN